MPPRNPSDAEPEPLPPLTGRPSLPALIAMLTIGALLAFVMFGIIGITSNGHRGHGYDKTACINNLRQIDGAKQTWALDGKISPTTNATPTWQQLAPFFIGPRNEIPFPPKCPAGGTYTLNDLHSAPTCSIPGHTLE